METTIINNHLLSIKEYNGQRVVTLRDIDEVHERPEGTARRNFNTNREHLIEGEDYFVRNSYEAAQEFGIVAPNGLTLITESGYLMLVKSFTDDLAWTVQRQLVKGYFRARAAEIDLRELSPDLQAFKHLFDCMARTELEQKRQAAALQSVELKVDGIRDVVALHPASWREESRRLLAKIAQKRGGENPCQEVNTECFDLVDKRGGVSLKTRLTNKQRRMAEEGVSKSKRDRLNKVDVIADDKKLIEIYLAIVKEMAVKYGVECRDNQECFPEMEVYV